jgi:nitrous oxide reductase accessory protein NosL
MRRLWLNALLFASLACSAGPPAAADPVWGKQACTHCSMLISDPHPSAQALLRDGTRYFFDDVGCLAAWLDRESERPVALWVRTIRNDGWIDAHEVRYSAGHITPMDFGFLPAAQGFNFEELGAAVRAKLRSTPGAAP